MIAADCPHRLDFDIELLLDEANPLDEQLRIFLGNLRESIELTHAVGPELFLQLIDLLPAVCTHIDRAEEAEVCLLTDGFRKRWRLGVLINQLLTATFNHCVAESVPRIRHDYLKVFF